MTAHVRTTNLRPRTLRLYRGEELKRKPAILRDGIDGREPTGPGSFPGLRRLQAASLPHELVADLMKDIVREHVRVGSAKSPFTSFSTDRRVAERYSRGKSGREAGVVMAVDVQVVHEYSAAAIPTASYGSFSDERGRLWIWVEGSHVGADLVIEPALAETFHALGARDREYLLLGHVSPSELRL
jgi:hypothetical protein